MSKWSNSQDLDKQAIREALAGYAAAAEVIERERIQCLRQMTPEESRRIYADLVAFHQHWKETLSDSDREGLERLAQHRLEEKLALRRALDKVALALAQAQS